MLLDITIIDMERLEPTTKVYPEIYVFFFVNRKDPCGGKIFVMCTLSCGGGIRNPDIRSLKTLEFCPNRLQRKCGTKTDSKQRFFLHIF